jgi:glutamate-ammonia-ligase adenylyltransferase
MIEDEVRRKGLDDNIKLGAGGIRETEFIVQSFQLVRGGSEAPLRDARLRPVLRYLGEAEHLDSEIAQRLDGAYVFLRRVENAIQMYGDEQTHALPKDANARTALCAAMQAEDWSSLLTQIDTVRNFVQQQFQQVFAPQGQQPAESPLRALVQSLWMGTLEGDAALEALYAAGFKQQPQAVRDEIETLHNARLVRVMREEASRKMVEVLVPLFEETLRQPRPETALARVLKLVQSVAGRSTYLTLLRENATARSQLVSLCAASPWLSELIAQSPVLLDTLLDPRSLYVPPERDELIHELQNRCADFGVADTEQAMDLLRRYQKEITLRVAAADLVHALPLVKVSDRLTWLAEAILAQALEYAWAEMREQYGQPYRVDGQPAGFAVIGYGKLGGIELGYGSDLDLVFLHDCDQLEEDSRGGGRAIDNGTYFSRLAQRLINWLATQTSAGRAYEIDMELRPNGRSGLLVSSLASFADYQQESAWTWEHQALTRARYICGSAEIGEGFASVRAAVLRRPRATDTLHREIIEMRAKMRGSLDKSNAELWDVKQGEGGLIDIEFITQYLVLRDAHRDAAVIEWSDNWRQLEALEQVGSIDSASKSNLIECYRTYRGWVHARSLQDDDARVPQAQFQAERQQVTRIWQAYFG